MLFAQGINPVVAPDSVAFAGNINNYVFWAVTATVTGILLYIVTRFIPWLIKEFGKALKEETEACRVERENSARAHAEEREIDRRSRHDIADRMNTAIADVCTEHRDSLKELRDEFKSNGLRLETALNRQTDSITGALKSQTEIIISKNGGRKSKLDISSSPNNLSPNPPNPPAQPPKLS